MPALSGDKQREGTWKEEGHDFVRAFSGAYLFGIPLLYTMEMWWIGAYADLWKLVVFLAAAFLINLYLAASTGFKHTPGLLRMIDQAIDATAVGLVASAAILLVLNRIGPDTPLRNMVGLVVIQAVPLSIGASIANSILGSDGAGREKGRQGDGAGAHNPWIATLRDMGATVAGGLLLGLSIAPTDEVPKLAAEIGPIHELSLIAVTILLSYMIVFEAGFTRRRPRERRALLQHPSTETAAAYVVSLLVSVAVLYLFGRIEWSDPWYTIIAQTVVLAFPVSIGGAAGRLVA